MSLYVDPAAARGALGGRFGGAASTDALARDQALFDGALRCCQGGGAGAGPAAEHGCVAAAVAGPVCGPRREHGALRSLVPPAAAMPTAPPPVTSDAL